MIYTFRALIALVFALALCAAANVWPQPVSSEISGEYIPVAKVKYPLCYGMMI